MKGLIRKDLYLMIKTFSFMQLLPLAAPVIVSIQNREFFMPILMLMTTFLFALQVTSTMSFDEISNWRKNVTAMPVTIVQEAASKYILAFTLAVLSAMILLILGLTVGTVNLHLELNTVLTYSLLSFSMSLLYNALIIPASYKFGTAKSRYVVMLLMIVPISIPYILNLFGIQFDLQQTAFTAFIFFRYVVLLLIIMFLSFFISIRILENKK